MTQFPETLIVRLCLSNYMTVIDSMIACHGQLFLEKTAEESYSLYYRVVIVRFLCGSENRQVSSCLITVHHGSADQRNYKRKQTCKPVCTSS